MQGFRWALFFQWLLFTIYPPRCPFCREILFENGETCPLCTDFLPHIPQFFCAACHQPGERIAGRCVCGGIWCISPFRYEGLVRIALLRYKFYHKRDYARTFAAILAEELSRHHADRGIDWITFVPTTKKSRQERGYDPSEVLAKFLAKRWGIPCVCLLRPAPKKISQRELSVRRRYSNAKRSFFRLDRGDLEGQRILLCDDILTTGATMERCAELLREQGAEVIGCTLAHGRWDRETIPHTEKPIE